ncbi:hypothetical protein F4805DRAFT_119242 [Annulohypoxylon moriforme]|nr:hypothetical protein F4805DRAFT_119242 [Annulohypoxylon moriforme]
MRSLVLHLAVVIALASHRKSLGYFISTTRRIAETSGRITHYNPVPPQAIRSIHYKQRFTIDGETQRCLTSAQLNPLRFCFDPSNSRFMPIEYRKVSISHSLIASLGSQLLGIPNMGVGFGGAGLSVIP